MKWLWPARGAARNQNKSSVVWSGRRQHAPPSSSAINWLLHIICHHHQEFFLPFLSHLHSTRRCRLQQHEMNGASPSSPSGIQMQRSSQRAPFTQTHPTHAVLYLTAWTFWLHEEPQSTDTRKTEIHKILSECSNAWRHCFPFLQEKTGKFSWSVSQPHLNMNFTLFVTCCCHEKYIVGKMSLDRYVIWQQCQATCLQLSAEELQQNVYEQRRENKNPNINKHYGTYE